MGMTVAVAVETVRPTAKTTIGHWAAYRDRSSVEIGYDFTHQTRAAVARPDEARRDRADGSTSHHGQDHAA